MKAKTKAIGLHESRTRVHCYLPITNKDEARAISLIVDYLNDQRKANIGVKGFTGSSMRPPAFTGYWWSSQRRSLMREQVVMFVIDYKLDFDDTRIAAKVEELHNRIKHAYKSCTGREQEVIWVVAHSVMRFDG